MSTLAAGVEPASRALHLCLTEQLAELRRRDGEIRRGEDEGVHQARVVCRRLRCALATYRPLVDRKGTDPLRRELKWFAAGLSGARDATVVRERLHGLLAQEPLVVGPVVLRLDTTYAERRRDAMGHISVMLDSPRYRDLLTGLRRLVDDPPWTEMAARDAREVLPGLVGRDWKRLRVWVRAVAAETEAGDRDWACHQARKAAKRLRCAAQVASPVVGYDARRLARATKRLTVLLGERQDTVMSRADLVWLAARADAAGESSTTWWRLHAVEQARAEQLDRDFTDAWDRLGRSGARQWLR